MKGRFVIRLSPFRGRKTGFLLEQAGEIVLILEVHSGSDFLDGKAVFLKKLLGPADPQLKKVLIGRKAGVLLEDAPQARIS